MSKKQIIKSISYNQDEIINNIISLHCKDGIDLDPTYSKGNFYKKIKQPKLKFDLFPQSNDVLYGDCRNLPIQSQSINTIMFDPPFLATRGPSLNLKNDSNKINKRFGVYPTEQELHRFYIDSLREFYRILNDDGIVIFKCQDKNSSQKQYFSHCFIYNIAVEIGFYPKDLFILAVKNRIVADWQAKNQKHARKFHSYFWVLKKSKTKIKYINEA